MNLYERNAFGAYLFARRCEAKMSRRQLARHLGISHVFLRQVELESGIINRESWTILADLIPGITIEGLWIAAALSGYLLSSDSALLLGVFLGLLDGPDVASRLGMDWHILQKETELRFT